VHDHIAESRGVPGALQGKRRVRVPLLEGVEALSNPGELIAFPLPRGRMLPDSLTLTVRLEDIPKDLPASRTRKCRPALTRPRMRT
jgi:hypothetical protein